VRTGSTALVASLVFSACGTSGPALPRGPVIEFGLDYAAARKEGHVPAGTTDEELQREAVAQLEARMRVIAGHASRVEAKGRDRAIARLEEGADPIEAAKFATTRTGHGNLQFRILVDPENVRQDQAASLWEGTVEEFKAYREAEVAEWRKARDQALAYVPKTHPKYRVIKRARTETESPEDFAVVLEPPSRNESFGGEILDDIHASTDETGMPAVAYDIKTEYQGAFGDWTERHVKQPLALILSNEFLQAPVLQSRLTDSVQITLGASDVAEAKQRQRELLATLLPLRVPLKVVRTIRPPGPR
jgi:preprotein translocase subunit SecD